MVLQPNGEGHAVTVRTDHGDFILDNMRNKVMLWSETEYTYLKRQSSDDPGRWVKYYTVAPRPWVASTPTDPLPPRQRRQFMSPWPGPSPADPVPDRSQ